MPRKKAKSPKVAKPYADFPLTAHRNGQWCKKIRGKIHYFGPVVDPDAALSKYLEERDDLQAGRIPNRERDNRTTTVDLVNRFIHRSRQRMEAGELSEVSYLDYFQVGELIVQHFGRTTDPEQLRPADFGEFRFKMAAKYAPSRLAKIVAVCRMIFKWGFDSEYLDRMPRFGPDFSTPAKSTHRRHRSEQEKKLLTAKEIKALIEAADPKWRAIILLCINGGLGNSDVSRLRLNQVSGDWLDFPREKTGIDRRIYIWPETLQAVEDYKRHRETPKPEASDLLFLSKHGGPLIVVRSTGKRTDLTIEGFRRIAKKAGIHRPRMGLYWLRHTYRTVADAVRDRPAIDFTMGHSDGSMAANYRHDIADDRLQAVAEHVRDWLFANRPE